MYNQQYPSYNPSSMSTSGIQGQVLEVTVVGCNKLKDTEWISRQDPYVCIEYGSNKSRTRTCTDGGKNPVFQEKFVYTLIEGLRELNIVVWNSNTVKYDDLIGKGKVPLQKVLSTGFDDSTWPIQSKSGRHSGEVRLIMHYANANANANSQKPSKPSPSAPPYGAFQIPQASMYSAPPPAAVPYAAPPASAGHYPPASAYPPSSHYPSYPPASAPYPPNPYGAPSAQPYGAPSAQPYGAPSAYPPQPYPPPQGSPYYPPGPYPGAYPPPPY